MKKAAIAVCTGMACFVWAFMAPVWTDYAEAAVSDLVWVDIDSQSFAGSGTDISGSELRGIWGSAEEDIFVVGPADTMVRFDGLEWSVQSIDTEGRELNAVYGTDAENIFALANTHRTIFYSADGTNWAKRSSDNLNNALYSLWGLTPDNMIATGNVSEFWVLVYYYYAVMYVNINNAANIATATPAAMIDADLYGVWGSATTDIYAVGQNGCKRNNLGYCTTDYTSIWHYDGNSRKNWTFVASPVDDTLYGVWGSAADDIYAVGANGCIVHFDGVAWSAQASPTAQTLRAVWGSGYDDVYAVGDAGTVLHFDGDAWTVIDTIPTAEDLHSIWGSSDFSVYIVGSNGTILRGAECFGDIDCDDGIACNGAEMCVAGACVDAEPVCDTGLYCDEGLDLCVECLDNAHCPEGFECIEGECVSIPDDPPVIGEGPFIAAGSWPLLSASQESPTVLRQNIVLLWTYSDDYASCSADCTHTAEYSVAGSDSWTAIVGTDVDGGSGYVSLPVDGLENATTYAFRFTVTDCAGQSTQSGEYYFRVATSDAPPQITGGPYLAAGTWPRMPSSEESAFVLSDNQYILWTFEDDYASCGALCTHVAKYRKVGEVQWTNIAVSTDPAGTEYASAELPVASLAAGTYQLTVSTRDCAGQTDWTNRIYYFKVAAQ